MLIEFRVANHRSLKEEQALSLEIAPGRQDPDDKRPRKVNHKKGLLPVTAIYGANASGKSNVLSALEFMHTAVLMSHRSWEPDGGVPRNPFAWGDGPRSPSLFEVSVIVEGIPFRYGFTVDNDKFLEEWLFAYPNKKEQLWFERELDDVRFGPKLIGENELAAQVTRTNSLFLSAAAQNRHAQLTPLYRWFAKSSFPSQRQPYSRYRTLLARKVVRWLLDEEQHQLQLPFDGLEEQTHASSQALRSFRDLLRAADVGIVDFKFEEDLTPIRASSSWRHGRQLKVRHQSETGEAWLPIEDESQGTLTLFDLGPALITALAEGTLVVVDELEASLHPLLGLSIVKQFNNPKSNPRNAQLIFTTHDTNLLGNIVDNPQLRRDQIWLTEKDTNGSTQLYPLSDFKPRKHENLERGYLQGRYGAVPFIDQLIKVQVDHGSE